MRYVRLFQDALREGDHMCLCGMLASSHRTLPEASPGGGRRLLRGPGRSWLGRMLRDGRQAGEFRFEGKPEATAEALLARPGRGDAGGTSKKGCGALRADRAPAGWGADDGCLTVGSISPTLIIQGKPRDSMSHERTH